MEFNNSQPIWQQLLEEFSRRVITGLWPAGERISSVRELAAEFGVNPNTVQRALTEFERIGLCLTQRTSGRFITEDQNRIDQLRTEQAQYVADAFIQEARGLNMTRESALDLIRDRWKDDTRDHNDHPNRN